MTHTSTINDGSARTLQASRVNVKRAHTSRISLTSQGQPQTAVIRRVCVLFLASSLMAWVLIALFLAVVTLGLSYDFVERRNALPRLVLQVITVLFATIAAALSQRLAAVQAVIAAETFVEVLHVISNVSPASFPYHTVPVARAIYFFAVLATAIDQNTPACVLFILACLTCILDAVMVNRHLLTGFLPTAVKAKST